METISLTLFTLLVAWGVVTAALIFLLIYRGTLESREDDQIFLDAAEESMANEQRAIVARIDKLSRPITALIVASGALLLIAAGMWLWQGFKNF
jgi:hypothetical protein